MQNLTEDDWARVPSLPSDQRAIKREAVRYIGNRLGVPLSGSDPSPNGELPLGTSADLDSAPAGQEGQLDAHGTSGHLMNLLPRSLPTPVLNKSCGVYVGMGYHRCPPLRWIRAVGCTWGRATTSAPEAGGLNLSERICGDG